MSQNDVNFFSFYVGRTYKILFFCLSLLLMWYVKHLTNEANRTTALYEQRFKELSAIE